MKKYAVVGNPVAHSRSPEIHMMFAKQTGILISYDKIISSEEKFNKTVRSFFDENGYGLNITVPFKMKAFSIIDDNLISERAKIAKAINTIWIKDGLLHGCNTDGVGLLRDLTRLDFNFKNARILIVGAGGAARGALQALLNTSCSEIHIANRTVINAQNLVEECRNNDDKIIGHGSLADSNKNGPWDLVINTTTSSLSNLAPTLPGNLYCKDNSLAYDMMYSKDETPFMRQARLDGATNYSDGLGMLVEQAAESFFIWHNSRPNTITVIDNIRKLMSK
ncbi:shikimate dehydrogenase [Candidatus Kinetoplastibacterium blastocrithidii TCC012E]|uniref:Shikimate dehydrogenase (NADP(+)) n=1 Tax=Candidatus Kinetoplastidibacterium blastocrithidiae TCC012E TaxID=1208922 RepID=M1M185_9PROT|nr:shikimate dehydrogenase [Candidatus Kinetoplastibacterium blastocrithidii]AFZ83227.1 shikimate 5-dehydrogenase [Candidatus Kinetoplastibacterium blastocrithidii (ex Strigomonas culicis)]AGF50041.1 shikimate dehydrogenase [Candidatus Kinetoplastibacterium blastocrithidii TCC012E]